MNDDFGNTQDDKAGLEKLTSQTQPVYNTLVSVVACIQADDETDATRKLSRALTHAGFDVYEDGQNAFLSEPDVDVTELPE